MTKHEVAVLACKILGIYFVVGGLSGLGYAVTELVRHFSRGTEGSMSNLWLATLVGSTLMVVFGILLWVLVDRIAARVVSGAEAPTEVSKISGADIQAIAFSVVGMLVLARFFPQLAQLIVYLSILDRYDHTPVDAMTKGRIGGLIVQLAIGLWLLLGSRGLVGLLKTVREAGLEKSESTAG